MKPFFLPLLLVTFALPPLWAEEGASDEADGGFKPPALTLLLESVRWGEPLWRPGWPPDFPPDGFRLRKGAYRSLSIKKGDEEFRFCREGEERDFPLFMEGVLVRGKLFYDKESRLRGAGAGDWELEILAYEDDLPSLVRMKTGEGWYFAGLKRRGNSILETWYDEAGGILSLWVYETLPPGEDFRIVSRESLLGTEQGSASRYYFDGRGLPGTVESGEETTEALYYREDLPRYGSVKNAAGGRGGERRFSFQWDEEGFLTRVSVSPLGTDPAEEPAGVETPAVAEVPAEYRYEYTLDEKGNWIERREILMFRRGGFLVPAPGEPVTRIIEYGASE
jgi:hypothetical protein